MSDVLAIFGKRDTGGVTNLRVRVVRVTEVSYEVDGKSCAQYLVDGEPLKLTVGDGPVSGHPEKWNDAEIAQMAVEYREGATLAVLGKRYGGSRAGIVKRLKDLGVAIRPTGQRKSFPPAWANGEVQEAKSGRDTLHNAVRIRELVMTAFHDGKNAETISEQVGIQLGIVRRVIDANRTDHGEPRE